MFCLFDFFVFHLTAEFFPERTQVQCLHRWQKVLNPELVKGPWTQRFSYHFHVLKLFLVFILRKYLVALKFSSTSLQWLHRWIHLCTYDPLSVYINMGKMSKKSWTCNFGTI